MEEPGRYRILCLLRVFLRPYKHPVGGGDDCRRSPENEVRRPSPIGDPQSRIPMTDPSSACKRGETQSALLRRNELRGWWMLSRRIAVTTRRAKESRTEQELGSGSCSLYNTERRRGKRAVSPFHSNEMTSPSKTPATRIIGSHISKRIATYRVLRSGEINKIRKNNSDKH